MFNSSDLVKSALLMAHGHSLNNREEITTSGICACFNCLRISLSKSIVDWVDEGDSTAICPHCGTDSVIGDRAGFDLTPAFLQSLRNYWFSRDVDVDTLLDDGLAK